MDMYKLNYTGGLKAYDMMNKLGTEGFTKESVEKDIKSFQTKPELRSDSAKLQDVLNDLNKSMVNFGKDATGIKIDGLSGISGTVDGIYNFITGGKSALVDTATDVSKKYFDSGLLSGFFSDEKQAKNRFKEMAENAQEAGYGSDKYMAMQEVVSILSSQKNYEYHNKVNTINNMPANPVEALAWLKKMYLTAPPEFADFPIERYGNGNIKTTAEDFFRLHPRFSGIVETAVKTPEANPYNLTVDEVYERGFNERQPINRAYLNATSDGTISGEEFTNLIYHLIEGLGKLGLVIDKNSAVTEKSTTELANIKIDADLD